MHILPVVIRGFMKKEKLLNIPIFDDIHCVEIVKYDKIMKYIWKL